jgi:hypothetical protein
MDWKVELVSSIEATAVEKFFERSMYASVEESADGTARHRTRWFGEAGRRRIELAEDKARRDPVWAVRMARRHDAFREACAVRDGNLAARTPTTCSTNCSSRTTASAEPTISPTAASSPSMVTVAIVPERCCSDLDRATATSGLLAV